MAKTIPLPIPFEMLNANTVEVDMVFDSVSAFDDWLTGPICKPGKIVSVHGGANEFDVYKINQDKTYTRLGEGSNGGGSITVKEYNLTSQLDGIETVFNISPEINTEAKISVYYAGQRLVQGINFSIDYDAHTLTTLFSEPLDSDEGRHLILVAVLTDGAAGTGGVAEAISVEPGTSWQNDRFFTLVQKNGWAMISSNAVMLGSVTRLSNGMILGNVPEGFRPILHVSCNCILSNTGQAEGSGFVGIPGKRFGEVQVHPNGNILLYGFREADYPVGTHFTFQIVYPIA